MLSDNLALFTAPAVEVPKLNVNVFKPVGDKVSIIPLADLHLGARKHAAALLREYLSYIMSTTDCYIIGLGDYIENATRTSVGLGMYEEEFHTPDQYDRIEEMLRPLARAGKIIGLHAGNHELRTTMATGLNPVSMLCKALDVPYLGYTAFHKWVVGNTIYRAISLHGRSAARSPSGRLNALRGLRDIANADIYLMGHLHEKAVHRELVYEINDFTDSVEANYRWYILGGSLLGWPETYADMSAMPPVQTGLVKIDLYTSKRHVDVAF